MVVATLEVTQEATTMVVETAAAMSMQIHPFLAGVIVVLDECLGDSLVVLVGEVDFPIIHGHRLEWQLVVDLVAALATAGLVKAMVVKPLKGVDGGGFFMIPTVTPGAMKPRECHRTGIIRVERGHISVDNLITELRRKYDVVRMQVAVNDLATLPPSVYIVVRNHGYEIFFEPELPEFDGKGEKKTEEEDHDAEPKNGADDVEMKDRDIKRQKNDSMDSLGMKTRCSAPAKMASTYTTNDLADKAISITSPKEEAANLAEPTSTFVCELCGADDVILMPSAANVVAASKDVQQQEATCLPQIVHQALEECPDMYPGGHELELVQFAGSE
ncbi:hypothetical protein ABZP36_011866 [Zizania latifolia]